jgi:hypothetical protein
MPRCQERVDHSLGLIGARFPGVLYQRPGQHGRAVLTEAQATYLPAAFFGPQ